MSERYSQRPVTTSQTRFDGASFGEVERSRMVDTPMVLTTFNAGDIVPIYCCEVLPSETISLDVSQVIRQTTLLTPTMGQMQYEIHAFFVPNRIVNKSSAAVFGENYNGSWTANEVTFAPLLSETEASGSLQIPVGSVADYYGFPTQAPLERLVLASCHDLKFRGYVEIYNRYFRDENYQAPIPYSKLNVYEGFFSHPTTPGAVFLHPDRVNVATISDALPIQPSIERGDGSYWQGAVEDALMSGSIEASSQGTIPSYPLASTFNALGKPLKANKKHDYFTSVLPTPQKGPSVFVPLAGLAPVVTGASRAIGKSVPARWVSLNSSGNPIANSDVELIGYGVGTASAGGQGVVQHTVSATATSYAPVNFYADLSGLTSVDVADLRQAAAIQQVYETLARGGSRYVEYIRSFFSLEVENPFDDIPTHLGYVRGNLDLYQTAQTSSSTEGSTPQGNLAAFGYTTDNGHLFTKTFLEHGYIHVFCIVRHKNIYPSYLSRDNFRRSMMDFYQPMMANLSEQPVYRREINPFQHGTAGSAMNAIGYQEAWAEYRMEPDRVSGYMRPGIAESLAIWNYADDVDTSFEVVDGDWLRSNSEEVLNRTLAVTSSVAHQFKAQFVFAVDKELPMPTYSVPGLDIL